MKNLENVVTDLKHQIERYEMQMRAIASIDRGTTTNPAVKMAREFLIKEHIDKYRP